MDGKLQTLIDRADILDVLHQYAHRFVQGSYDRTDPSYSALGLEDS